MFADTFPLDAALNVFSRLFDNVSSPAINLLDRNYTVLWANRGMSIAVHRPLAKIVGRQCFKAFLGRSEPCEPCLLKIVSRTGRPYTGERLVDLYDGTKNYTRVTAFPVFDGTGLQYLFEIATPAASEEQQKAYIDSLERALRGLAPLNGPQVRHAAGADETSILTPREIEVLRLAAKGFSNTEIARILSMSPNTAKTHIKNIFGKLDVTDRTEAAVWAARHNLL